MQRRAKGSGYVEKVGKGHRARKTVNGKSITSKVFKTWAEADKELAKLAPKLHDREDSPTMAQYTLELLEGRFAKKLRRSTWETSEVVWRVHLSPSALGKTKVEKVRRRDVQNFIDDLKGSPAWVRRIGAVVSVVLSNAVEDELLSSNPAFRIEYPEVEERDNRTLTPQEAMKLLNPNTRLGAMILTAAHTGLRRGELCGLRWEDVKDGFLRVKRSMSAVRGGDVETKTKTRASMSDVPLTQEALDTINAQPKRGLYVFTTEDGGPVSPSNLSRDWRLWADKNGLAGMRLHDLRGSFVSLLIESGADVRTVQELARHADPRTTMKLYARTRLPVKEAAVERLRAAITHTVTHKPDETSQDNTQVG